MKKTGSSTVIGAILCVLTIAFALSLGSCSEQDARSSGAAFYNKAKDAAGGAINFGKGIGDEASKDLGISK